MPSDKDIKKFQESFMSHLKTGLIGRVLNDYPLEVDQRDVNSFEAIFKDIKEYESSSDGFYDLVNSKDKAAIKGWVKDIARRLCNEMLDGHGCLKWSWLNRPIMPRGVEKHLACYRKESVEAFVCSSFVSVKMEVCTHLASLVNRHEPLMMAFMRWIKNYGEWIREVIQEKQHPETRSVHALMQALEKDFVDSQSGLNKIFLTKERLFILRFIKAAKNNHKNAFDFFVEMHSDAVNQKLKSLLPLIEHYKNKMCLVGAPDALSHVSLLEQKRESRLKLEQIVEDREEEQRQQDVVMQQEQHAEHIPEQKDLCSETASLVLVVDSPKAEVIAEPVQASPTDRVNDGPVETIFSKEDEEEFAPEADSSLPEEDSFIVAMPEVQNGARIYDPATWFFKPTSPKPDAIPQPLLSP